MLGFMDYVQSAWFASTGWDADNSYGTLTSTSRSLLDFPTPIGLALHCSSLASRSFANSYSLGNAGSVDGSLSYLYSSRPLLLLAPGQDLGHGATINAEQVPVRPMPSRSPDIPLRSVIRGYRELADLKTAGEMDAREWEVWHAGKRVDVRDTLLYGRLYLPNARLEALYLRRLSPVTQLKVACVSSAQLRNRGSMLFTFQRDVGKTSMEYLYSTDGGLLGVRGLYNFGPDLESGSEVSVTGYGEDGLGVVERVNGTLDNAAGSSTRRRVGPPNGRFSAGGELYYGALNKTGGMSVGCRFATLPRHHGFPYTMTLTLNPLMGNLSSTYAVKAGPALSLATRFDFNVYSYESEYQIGFELWKRKRKEIEGEGSLGEISDDSGLVSESVRWAVDKIKESERRGWISDSTRQAAGSLISGLEPEHAGQMGGVLRNGDGQKDGEGTGKEEGDGDSWFGGSMQPMRDEDTAGVLKARINQQGVLGVLWEGRVKQLLYTFGLNVDFRQREQVFRGVGIEFHYSS